MVAGPRLAERSSRPRGRRRGRGAARRGRRRGRSRRRARRGLPLCTARRRRAARSVERGVAAASLRASLTAAPLWYPDAASVVCAPAARDVLDNLAQQRVVPVLRCADADDAVGPRRAAAAGGFGIVELTMTTPGVLGAASTLAGTGSRSAWGRCARRPMSCRRRRPERVSWSRSGTRPDSWPRPAGGGHSRFRAGSP